MANEFRIKNGLIVDQGTSQLTGSFLVSGSQTLTGSLNVSAGITGSLFGTASNIQGGTANYIPLWNTATSVSSSTIYQSSGNVGIQNTSSAYPLTVGTNTAGGGSDFTVQTNSNAAKVVLSSQTSNTQIGANPQGSYFNGMPPGASFGSSTAGARTTIGSTLASAGGGTYINFSTNGANTGLHVTHNYGSDLMTVLSSGNVGLNTTTPNATLDVNGNAIVTGSLTVTNGITGSLFGTSSWAVSASSALSAPLYLPLTGGTISGNLTVIGTSSFAYTTSSIVQVGASTITLNTNNPATRFGGITVIDSGSFGNSSTGSLFWDSLNNRWIYSNPSGSSYDGGMLISGPRNTSGLGNEQGTANNYITKGQGGDHITSSMIYEDSSGRVGIGTTSPIFKLEVSGSDISANGIQIGRGGGYLDTNTAVGYQAVSNNTTGTTNTGIGRGALYFNSNGIQNTAVGYRALYSTNGGSSNTAVGDSALISNTTGDSNTAVGIGTLNNNTTGYENTALGHSAGYSLTTGFKNTFIGRSAGTSATTAQYSTVIGGYLTPGNSIFNENETLSIERPDATVNSYLGESAGLPHFWAPATQYVGDGGTGVMLTLQSTAYSAFFMDYNVEDLNANMRAGTIKAIWTYDGSSIKVTEETTDSIGTTSGIVISVTYSSGTIQVNIDNNNGYGAYYNLTSRLLIRPTILNF